MLQQDNAPAHHAFTTRYFLAANNVRVYDPWQANSSDMNPIEHMWTQLKELRREAQTPLPTKFNCGRSCKRSGQTSTCLISDALCFRCAVDAPSMHNSGPGSWRPHTVLNLSLNISFKYWIEVLNKVSISSICLDLFANVFLYLLKLILSMWCLWTIPAADTQVYLLFALDGIFCDFYFFTHLF